jgi:hypothetical protein
MDRFCRILETDCRNRSAISAKSNFLRTEAELRLPGQELSFTYTFNHVMNRRRPEHDCRQIRILMPIFEMRNSEIIQQYRSIGNGVRRMRDQFVRDMRR